MMSVTIPSIGVLPRGLRMADEQVPNRRNGVWLIPRWFTAVLGVLGGIAILALTLIVIP